MLTHEEAIICCIELRKRGYRYFFLEGTDESGYFLWAVRCGRLDHPWCTYHGAFIYEPKDLAEYIREPG